MLSELETALIERACERLVHDAVHLNDTQDFAGFAGLFTVDGSLIRPGAAPLVGREAIRQAYEARPRSRVTRHLCTNVRITVESADRARGLTYVLLFGADAAQPPANHYGWPADARQLLGQFEDEFARTSGGWRIHSRRASFAMHTPAAGR
jgi:uncharacterized protein (TIGR02246 family)